MNKKTQSDHTDSFTETADKIAAQWQLKTQHNTPSKVDPGEGAHGILQDLVAMPTVTGNYAAIHESLDYIERFLNERTLHVTRYEWNGVESLVATTQATMEPTVCFMGHIDVVPAPAELFQLTEASGRLYGRGVLDMKGPIAAFLGALQKLQNPADYNFGIIITSDEEVGGFDGAARIAEEGFRPKMMIIPDGGGNWNMERFAKGIWHLTIEATGKAAHGSRPWEGENAIDKLLSVISQIQALFPEPSPDTSTINLGMLQGGEALNQIPSTATASMDMRFSSAEEQARIVNEIQTILKQGGVKLTTELRADPMINDPNNSYLQQYAQCTERIIGRPVEWVISNAGNDGRFFAKYSIPCAIAYPPGENHHGLKEYISKEGLFQQEQLFQDYLNAVAKI